MERRDGGRQNWRRRAGLATLTSAIVTAAALAASSAPALAAGTSYTWIGSAQSSGGDNHSWTDSRNWSPSGVPGAGDSVSIAPPDGSHCTAHVDNVPTVALAGFSLSQPAAFCGSGIFGGDLTVTGTFSWDGGTLNTPTTIAPGATGTISGTNGRLNTLDANMEVGGTLALSGIADSGASNAGGFRINNPDVLHVDSGGTLDSEGPNAVQDLSCCNAPAKIVNDGTLDVSSGDFTVRGVEVDQNGTLSASSGGRLVSTLAPLTASNGATYSGSGGWLIEQQATAKLAGTQNIGSGFHLELGGLDQNSPAQLGGTATLTGAGVLDWTGGTIEGNLTIAHGMEVHAFGAHTDNGKRGLSGQDGLSGGTASTLTNHGTISFGNGATVLTSNQAKLVNSSDGTLTLAPGTQFASVGCCTNPDRVINHGQVAVTTGTSTDPVVIGHVSYQASGGSTSVPANRSLQLSGGPRGSLASTAVRGGGTLAVADPTTVSGPITVGTGTRLALQPGGSFDGTATIGGPGSLPWTGGAFSGNVTVTAGGGVPVSGPDTKTIANVAGGSTPSKLTLKAPTVFAAGTSANPNLVELGSSTLTLASTTSALNHVELAHGKLVNTGSLTTNPGTTGTVELPGTGQFINSGTVTVHSGTLQDDGDYSQTAGVTNVLAGTHLNLFSTGHSIALAGGVLEGTGTIGAGVANTGGTVKPAGASTGVLHVSGPYTQGPQGTLALDLAAKSRDLLAVVGTASLKGRLTAHNVGTYTPKTGTSLLALNSSGLTYALGCATTSGSGSKSGHWAPSHNSTSLHVTWRAGAHTSCSPGANPGVPPVDRRAISAYPRADSQCDSGQRANARVLKRSDACGDTAIGP